MLPGDSDHAFGAYLVEIGWVEAGDFARRNDAFFAAYQSGQLDISAYIEFITEPWRERPLAESQAALANFLQQKIGPLLRREALDLVRRHRDAGDRLAIVTATNDFVTRPIATHFGIGTLIATELERDSHGLATGAIRGVPSFGAGKVTRVENWLASHGSTLSDFDRSIFYSDSTNDLPLLERVSHPVATNPGPALERIALARGWPVLKLFA